MRTIKSLAGLTPALLVALGGILLAGCKTEGDNGHHARTVKYTCVHHPEVVQDGPGTCPKCGMALVPK